MLIFSLILLGVLLNAAAQLLLKAGMSQIGHFEFSMANALPIGLQVAGNPSILTGLCLYMISVVVWLLVLSRVQVSYAYPMLSIGYIAVSYTHLRAHETPEHLVCRLLLEK